MFRLRILLAVWLTLGLVAPAMAERRVALLLATEDYQHLRDLSNPVNDARAMETMLESLGFEVWLETDRDLRRMRRALEDFREDAAGADLALFFYAGHGVAVEGVNYLLPSDTEATSSDRLKDTALALSEVQAVLDAVAPSAIMLLDACRDDPFAQGAVASADGRGAGALADDPPQTPPPVPGMGRIGRADGAIFAFAAAPGETASDGTDGNSPFTAALLRHFGTDGVELKSALTMVQQDVYDRSRGKQLPYIESGLPALVFISGGGTLPERDALLLNMAGLTPEIRAEVEAVAAQYDMPFAPLYGAVISGDLVKAPPEERQKKLAEAADYYAAFQTDLNKFASEDPRVAELRAEARGQLELGAVGAALSLLAEATAIDEQGRIGFRDSYVTRTLSQASTHMLKARAALTDLRYDVAVEDLVSATALYAEIEPKLPDRAARLSYADALADLGALFEISGNSVGALQAYMTLADLQEVQVRQNPADPDWTRGLIAALRAAGEVFQDQGYLPEAETVYVRAMEFARWQLEQAPDDAGAKRDMMGLQTSLGDLLKARSDYSGAGAAYAAAQVVADDLMHRDPDNPEALRDMAHVLRRIGVLALALRDFTGARTAYDQSMQIVQRLADRFPDEAGPRADLAVAYERLGEMMEVQGDADSALAIYTEALNIRETLAVDDPSNMTRKSEVAAVYVRLGDAYAALGDVGSSLMAQEQARALRDDLFRLDPQNTSWAADLAQSIERIGGLHRDERAFDGALEAYGRALELRQAIIAIDPANITRQQELGAVLSEIATVQDYMGLGDVALAGYEDVLSLRRALAQSSPLAQFRRDLTATLRDIGFLKGWMGDLEGQRAAMAEAFALAEGLAAEFPEDQSVLRDLNVIANGYADVLTDLDQGQAAVSYGQIALDTTARMLALRPGDTLYLSDRLVSANRLGDAQRAVGDLPGALATFRIMADLGYQLSQADPWNAARAGDYAIALERIAAVHALTKDYPAARAELDTALGLRRWILGQKPASIPDLRALAVALQNMADTHFYLDDRAGGAPFEAEAQKLMREQAARVPGDAGVTIDLVIALDRSAAYAADPAPLLREALSLLEMLEAEGRLPGDIYRGWMADYRTRLGLP